jgi:hypothetical protein
MRRGLLWPTLLATATFGVGVPAMQAATSVVAHAASAPHIMELMDENQSYSSIIGNSSAPYLNSLAATYAVATNWSSNEHVSWKDYNIAVGGSDFGKESGISASNKILPNELDSAGISWKGYFESMPTACDTKSSGDYDSGHNPFVHFQSITGLASECKSHVVPYTQSGMVSDLNSGSAPDFVWVTPNLCDDMHTKCGSTNPVKVGDSWLSTFIPAVQSTNWYSSGGIIIITWDEAATSDTSGCCGDPGGGHIATLVISAASSGHFTGVGDHDGTLHALEEAYGVKYLGASGSGHGDLTGAFGGGAPSGTISGTVTNASGDINGATVSCTCSGSDQTTDVNGFYQFTDVTPNTSSTPYTMTFSDPAYQSQTIDNVVVSGGGTTTENAQLQPSAGQSILQDDSTASTSVGTALTVSLNPTTAGDLLVVSAALTAAKAPAASVSAVSDSSGTDGYTKGAFDDPTSSRSSAEIWYSPVAAGGVTSVTVTFSNSVSAVVRVYEIAGAGSIDQMAAAAGETTMPTAVTGTTTNSNEVGIAVIAWAGTGSQSSPPGAPWTNDPVVAVVVKNYNMNEQASDVLLTGTQALTASDVISSSTSWAVAVATFM